MDCSPAGFFSRESRAVLVFGFLGGLLVLALLLVGGGFVGCGFGVEFGFVLFLGLLRGCVSVSLDLRVNRG